jgi:hypothetical protein
MMKKVLAAVTGAALLLAAGVAVAADVKGAITAVNAQGRTVTINGVAYTFPANVDMAGLAVGQTVSLTYATANNVNTVSKVTK